MGGELNDRQRVNGTRFREIMRSEDATDMHSMICLRRLNIMKGKHTLTRKSYKDQAKNTQLN